MYNTLVCKLCFIVIVIFFLTVHSQTFLQRKTDEHLLIHVMTELTLPW